ncbi:MAG: tRNA (adenosine(37)-N6)-dimethylallyltransferase MiaA [Bacteroidetes bacterium]|nr:tRNA (adenosine(37)-N6)-dimethylallyltransferase MiaA [Bacteroidota bacterium]
MSSLLVLLGPTASGKTRLAALVAHRMGGEIISADSRQVYRGMTIGTGKDLDDYIVDGNRVPYHLIDIAEPTEEYSVFRFQKDFLAAYNLIREKGHLPILCGGTGLYIESVLKPYRLIEVPENETLRKELSGKSMEELTAMISSMKTLHATTEIRDKSRLIRAIEIEQYHMDNPETDFSFPQIDALIYGIHFPRELHRRRITARLEMRLNTGMVEEVQQLLAQGIDSRKLMAFGLEYKYITQYLLNELTREQMFEQLNTAIHRFAKRQMTWFRRMERNGINIHWLEGRLPAEENLKILLQIPDKSH